MLKKLSFVLALLIITSICFASPCVYAYKEGHKQMSKMGFSDKLFYKFHMILMNRRELDLSDEQYDEIKKLKFETKRAYVRQKAEIEYRALEIKEKLWEDVVDVKAIEPLIEKKYKLKMEKSKMLVEAYAK